MVLIANCNDNWYNNSFNHNYTDSAKTIAT